VAALASRVVEVIADLGPTAEDRYRYGSGCIVRARTVLTAAHLVVGAVSVVVRPQDKREYSATIDPRFVGDADGPSPDLALLEIDDPAFALSLSPIRLAAVDRESGEPVERCHAVGYPWFAEKPSRIAVRDTVDAIGIIPVMSKLATGLLSVQVSVAPRELPPQQVRLGGSQWSGMSGAPVVAGGYLLGVVTEHAPREGSSTITAVPLMALQPDPEREYWGPGVADPAAWWSRLGTAGIDDLPKLPARPPLRHPPAYRATLQEFGRTLHQRMPQLLGRDRELAEIKAFATGSDGYLWLVGGAFTGKTALLYEAATVGLPDEVEVVCYFLSRRASDASSDRFLAAVIPQLAYLCEVTDPELNRDQFNALWNQAVSLVTRRGRHLLLVVDGLDEDLRSPHSPSVASLLPTMVGTRAHVLVSSRPRPDVPEDVPDGHPLKAKPVQLAPFKDAQKLADLARKEIYELIIGHDADLSAEIFGFLTAAAGPLSLMDLISLRSDDRSPPTAADIRHVRRLIEDRAARSLERVGPVGGGRYQFAHASLLEYAQTVPDLCDSEFRQRIHLWAARWRDAGWPASIGDEQGTPLYLLDTYPAVLTKDPHRLARLVGDIGWIAAAIASAGIDHVLADLSQAAAATSSPEIAAVEAIVRGQAADLQPQQLVNQPGYILRQLWIRAIGMVWRPVGPAEIAVARNIGDRLRSLPVSGMTPLWSQGEVATPAQPGDISSEDARPGRRSGRRGRKRTRSHPITGYDSPVLAVSTLADGRVITGGLDGRVVLWDPMRPSVAPTELGGHNIWVNSASSLPDGRVVTGGFDRRVLVWDPSRPGTTPTELGQHDGEVHAIVTLADGRVITGGFDRRVLLWDPSRPGAAPAELGHHNGWVWSIAALANGRVVTGGDDWRVLVWDPSRPGAAPAELGHHNGRVWSIAGLADGRVVTGGADRRVLVWDPSRPGAAPAELGRHYRAVRAVAALEDGRVISAGLDRRVLVWNSTRDGSGIIQLICAVTALAVVPLGSAGSGLIIVHEGSGCSLWSLAGLLRTRVSPASPGPPFTRTDATD
jgi:hypothetical protein